uniref:Endonuclease/exonuclease/phosphatase domain-containing protein n=1 Tax=Ditylum brightwellii TaxID=49249 RepID=A0A7S1ZJL2_9STRA
MASSRPNYNAAQSSPQSTHDCIVAGPTRQSNPLKRIRRRDFKTISGCSQNVQGLKDDKLESLAHHAAEKGIDFICIQETLLSEDSITTVKTFTSPPSQCTFFHHGQGIETDCGSGGVGILLSSSGTKAWERAGRPEPVYASLTGGIARAMGLEIHVLDIQKFLLKYFIISAHHPDSSEDSDTHLAFLETLLELYENAPCDATIISGESINAEIGRSIIFPHEEPTSHPSCLTGPFGTHKVSNERGERMSQILGAAWLCSAGTWFEKKRYDTFFDKHTKKRVQYDHIFVTQKEKRSVTNCSRACPIIQSEHHAVVIKLRVAAHIPKKGECSFAPAARYIERRQRRRSRHQNRVLDIGSGGAGEGASSSPATEYSNDTKERNRGNSSKKNLNRRNKKGKVKDGDKKGSSGGAKGDSNDKHDCDERDNFAWSTFQLAPEASALPIPIFDNTSSHSLNDTDRQKHALEQQTYNQHERLAIFRTICE